MDKKEYFNLCESHDWFFDMSDDGAVYRKGLKAHDLLRQHAYAHDNLYKIFKDFQDYYWGQWMKGSKNTIDKPQFKDY